MPPGSKPGEYRGGGRKPGKASKKALARLAEIQKIVTEEDLKPIAVMTDNMVFWHNQAIRMGEKLEGYVLDIDDPEAIDKLTKLIKLFFQARENSQKCAVDAAPYYHPRLAAVTVKSNPEDTQTTIVVKGGLPAKTIAAAIAGNEAADASY